jgi:mannosylglycerate hydrolase
VAWELDAVGLREGEPAARVEVELALDAGAPFLRIRVRGENRSPDHRLRLVVATGVHDPEVWADAAFGPVRRAPLVLPPEDMAHETPPRTAPLHRYVSLFGADFGATLYSDGLAEYEAMPDGRVAVTLLRAVGELSRNDLPERPGHAGWPVPTPEAQCLGPFDAELALLLHGGRRDAETIALIERTADDALLPLRGTTLRSAIAVHDARGVELRGEGLTCTTVKDAADGDWLVLRCVNLLDEPVRGAWRLPFAPREAKLARLDETPLEPLATESDEIHFDAPARAVVTILVH